MNEWYKRAAIAGTFALAGAGGMHLANKPLLPQTDGEDWNTVPARVEDIRLHVRVNGQQIILKVEDLEYRTTNSPSPTSNE